MGTILAVTGDMGFIKINSQSNVNGEWIIFPANKFDNLIQPFETDEDEGINSLSWYLSQTPWLRGEYDYLKMRKYTAGQYRCSYANDRLSGIFKDEQSLHAHYNAMEIKFKLIEDDLFEEVLQKINRNPTILNQVWQRNRKVDLDLFQELQEIIIAAARNDQNFSAKTTHINNGFDFNFEFYSGRNDKVGRIFDAFWKATGDKGNKLLFSFRLSDLIDISTHDGGKFTINTKVGKCSFPWSVIVDFD